MQKILPFTLPESVHLKTLREAEKVLGKISIPSYPN
jgi:hypothetical protein